MFHRLMLVLLFCLSSLSSRAAGQDLAPQESVPPPAESDTAEPPADAAETPEPQAEAPAPVAETPEPGAESPPDATEAPEPQAESPPAEPDTAEPPADAAETPEPPAEPPAAAPADQTPVASTAPVVVDLGGDLNALRRSTNNLQSVAPSYRDQRAAVAARTAGAKLERTATLFGQIAEAVRSGDKPRAARLLAEGQALRSDLSAAMESATAAFYTGFDNPSHQKGAKLLPIYADALRVYDQAYAAAARAAQ
jgi:hypothetical protein